MAVSHPQPPPLRRPPHFAEDFPAAARRFAPLRQDTAVSVRRGKAGEHVERAEGLIAAAYRHRMSRAFDPQLHPHVVAANLAQGPDGHFTALHSSQLYRGEDGGVLYQAHLRALVSERLGLEWGLVTNGAAEFAGVTRSVIEFFSKRRQEMQRYADYAPRTRDAELVAAAFERSPDILVVV